MLLNLCLYDQLGNSQKYMIYTFNLLRSPAILSVAGVATDGDKFDAGVTGSDVHLCQKDGDGKLAILGLSEPVLLSGVRRKLLSPSAMIPFFLKLKPRKKPTGEEPLLPEPWD